MEALVTILIIIIILAIAHYFDEKKRSGEIQVQKNSKIKLSKQVNNIKEFNPTKKVGNYFYIDENKKQWVIPDGVFSEKIKKAHIYNYSDIVNFELIEDGNSIAKGGLGRAVVGGALFGGVGAVVGGITGKKKLKKTCSKLQIKITLNNLDKPAEYINLIMTEFKKDSFVYQTAYKSAQEIMALLEIMTISDKLIDNPISNTDEILKFKKLLDEGIITQEDFEKKKQELLK